MGWQMLSSVYWDHVRIFLFNSLDELQTKPENQILYICDFRRSVLNVRSTRSHPTLAPRPQIQRIWFPGFCAVAVEDELNSKWEDLGTKTLAFYPYHFNLTTNFRARRELQLPSQNSRNHYLNLNKIQSKTDRETNRHPIFVASEQGLDASARANIQTAATKVTNIGCRFASRASVLMN